MGRPTNENGDRAVLWQGGTLYDLNDRVDGLETFVLREATDINDNGWITGTGYDPTADRLRAFVLMPGGTVATTPEPASALLVLAGLGGLALRRRT